MSNIYYLGPVGSFSYLLARQAFQGEEYNLVACDSFKEISREVAKDDLGCGVIPISNSITSTVHELSLIHI